MNIPAAKIYFPEEDRNELLSQIDEILQFIRNIKEKERSVIMAIYRKLINIAT